MKTLYKNLFTGFLILFAGVLIFGAISTSFEKATVLSLNELVTKINNDEVTQITVNGDNLAIVLKDNSEAESHKESNLGLTETLKNYGVDSKKINQVKLEIQDKTDVSLWINGLFTVVPILIALWFFWFIFKQAKNGSSQIFSFGKSNLKLFSPFNTDNTNFADVAGLKEAKQELQEVVDFLKNPKKFFDIGAKIPRGVLLMGNPGTGKTLLARAVAGESGVPFFSISASEFVEMFVGVGASRTRDAFATAKKAAPAILFIDEIDAIGRQRGSGHGGHEEREQTLNQILVEMDGFDRDTQVIVLAATNRSDVLDPALLRPGRFDRHVILDMPDIKDREDILKIHAKGKPLAPDVALEKLAIRTPGFTGADLANLMNEGAILAARDNRKTVTQADLYEAVEKVMLGPERRGRVINQKEKEITAYHEAGHALVGASLEGSDPVHKVSIISRGYAGGYTLNLPTEEQRLRTKSQFLTDLAILMGGYVAEKETFGEMSTGASNDLEKASRLARLLVTKYGMSALGPISTNETNHGDYLNHEASFINHSEKFQSEIDTEMKKFLADAHNTAEKIITKKKTVLKAIASALLEKEVLEKEDFELIISSHKLA